MPRRSSRSESRRLSVTDQSLEILEEMRQMRSSMEGIWERVGFTAVEKEERVGAVYLHFRNLIESMLEEEERMESDLAAEVEASKELLKTLSKQLGRPAPAQLQEDDGLLAIARRFKDATKELREERDERVARRDALLEVAFELAKALELEPYDFPDDEVPKLKDLEALDRQSNAWAELLGQRKEAVAAAVVRLREVSAQMDLANSSFARAVLEEDGDSYSLSGPAMENLELGMGKVEAEWEAACAAMAQAFASAREELEEWMDKCLVPAEERARALGAPAKELYSQADVEALETETARWKAYYAERREILDKAEAWECGWKEKVAMETKDGLAKYNNRGGGLEKQLKRQRQLEKELPRLEAELNALLIQWRKTHPSEQLSLAGFDPLDHIRRVKEEYKAGKERSRAEKDQAKRRELMEATAFGTPATPASARKRPLPATQGSTFAKAPRAASAVGEAKGTPVRTRQGLTLASGGSVTKSASRLPQPTAFATPSSAKRLRKAESTWSLRKADSIASLRENLAPSSAKKPRMGTRVSPRQAAKAGTQPLPLEETIAEQDFLRGDFHNSSIIDHK